MDRQARRVLQARQVRVGCLAQMVSTESRVTWESQVLMGRQAKMESQGARARLVPTVSPVRRENLVREDLPARSA